MKKILVLINSIIFLVILSFGIVQERNYDKNKVFYLELRPVDPRSLLQGDYMELSYQIENNARNELFKKSKGSSRLFQNVYILVKLDENRVAHFVSISKEEKKGDKEFTIKAKRGLIFKIGGNSFFFENGKAKDYENAKYGKVVLRKNGTLKLIGVEE